MTDQDQSEINAIRTETEAEIRKRLARQASELGHERKRLTKLERRIEAERVATVALFDTPEKRNHWRELCATRWDSGDLGRRVILVHIELLESLANV